MGAFLFGIWNKIQGFVAMAAGALILIWYVFSRGEKKAKAEAEVKELKEEVIVANTITKSITDDAKVVAEIETKVDALPIDDVRAHARKWMRDKT
jgi:hypothetical protein